MNIKMYNREVKDCEYVYLFLLVLRSLFGLVNSTLLLVSGMVGPQFWNSPKKKKNPRYKMLLKT